MAVKLYSGFPASTVLPETPRKGAQLKRDVGVLVLIRVVRLLQRKLLKEKSA